MAWYNGTFSCGHEGRVDITGPTKNRQWKADRRFEGVCEDCYRAMKEKERQEANAKAAEAAIEMELIELVGTEKQVAWANTLRNKRIEELEDLREKINNHSRTYMVLVIKKLNVSKEGCHTNEEMAARINEYLDKAEEFLMANEKASYWIDNKDYDLYDIFEKIADKINVNEIEVVTEKELIAEATVAPTEIKFKGVVEIKSTEDKIEVKYEKNEDFKEIVKQLKYKWDGVWQRKINEITGSYIDRAAELGNKLLNAGFSISIQDEEIREKAINGDFEPECDRWIYFKDGKLGLKWWEDNDKLYSASRKLPSSKWDDRKTWVNVSHFEQVEEFAEMYGFKYTKNALENIDKYKKELSNIQVVAPGVAKEKELKNGLEDILNSSTDILDDLRED